MNELRVWFQDEEEPCEVEDGSVFSDVLGEELDSGVVIIPHSKRLGIEPYSFATVYVSVDGVNVLRKTMLVDNFTETEIDLDNHIYNYVVNLMSCTKLLEKVQLPNKTFTNSVNGRNITLKKAITDLVNCYSPIVKVKSNGENRWEYQRLFSVNFGTFSDVFESTYIKDTSLSSPTLRMAITALSSQIGFIPKMDDARKIGFLKLDKTSSVLKKENGVNYSTRTMSSDSYVTSIQSISDNILQSGNYVRNELIGFRDKDKAIIKQTENCFIQTDYPIYKVKSLKCGFYSNLPFINFQGRTSPTTTTNMGGSDYGMDKGTRFIVYNASGNPYVNLVMDYAEYNTRIDDGHTGPTGDIIGDPVTYTPISCLQVRAKMLKKRGSDYSQGFYVDKVVNLGNADLTDGYAHSFTQSCSGYDAIVFEWILRYRYHMTCVKATNPSINGVLHDEIDKERSLNCCLFTFAGNRTINDYSSGTFVSVNDDKAIFSNLRIPFTGFDITKLVKNADERKLLSMDFTKINDNSTIDELGKNYYSTVQYAIGDNKITGFSSTYSSAFLWFSDSYTIGEKILNFLCKNIGNDKIRLNVFDIFGLPDWFTIKSVGISNSLVYHQGTACVSDEIKPAYANTGSDSDYFSTMFFDVEYQPLNKVNIRYTKDRKDEPIPITQLDTKANGLTSLEDLSLVEMDNVNRLGNAMTTISQTTSGLSGIVNVGATYDGMTIFKRSVAYNRDFFQVSYMASEDYIIKNFSTSVQTKYRAYEYVDYSQCVLRKENLKVFAYIGSKWLKDGLENDYKSFVFSSGLSALLFGNTSKISYAFEHGDYHTGGNETVKTGDFKFDCSVSTAGKSVIMSFTERDNVSPGGRISHEGYTKYIGGLPQEFYVWENPTEQNIDFGFTSSEGVQDRLIIQPSSGNLYDESAFLVPLIKDGVNINSQSVFCNVEVDKDISEILNFTFQIEYYSRRDEVQISSAMPSTCSWVSGYYANGLTAFVDDSDKIDDISDYPVERDKSTEKYLTYFIEKIENVADHSRVSFTHVPSNGWLRVFKEDTEVIRFNLAKGKVFYISMNLTKTFNFFNFDGNCVTLKSNVIDLKN